MERCLVEFAESEPDEADELECAVSTHPKTPHPSFADGKTHLPLNGKARKE